MRKVELANGMKMLAPESSDLRSGRANRRQVEIAGKVIAASERRRWIEAVEEGRREIHRMRQGER